MEFETLKKAIVDILKVDPGEIMEDTTFLGDLGADSLDIYQIVNEVEEELHITLVEEDIERIFNEQLEKTGALKKYKCGEAILTAINSGEFVDLVLKYLRNRDNRVLWDLDGSWYYNWNEWLEELDNLTNT